MNGENYIMIHSEYSFKGPIKKKSIRRRLMWAGHAWRKQGSQVRQAIEKELKEKIPLRRPSLR